MSKYKIGDFIIATKNIKPYFSNLPHNVIPKGAVGKVTCVTIDKYVKYLNVIWISDEIDKENIPVSINGIKKIPEDEFTQRAVEFAI